VTLGAIFYYILKNPSCYERLQREIDSVSTNMDASGAIPFSIAHELPYLNACIKEAFRMHPAARWAPERVVPPSGATICGHFIPGGTVVGVNAWVIHRRTDIFGEDAHIYRPERWLKEGEFSIDKIHEMERMLLQFGSGNYTCIGKNISLLEMYKLVPAMFSKFQVRASRVFELLTNN
jgi:cytochrome P450